VGEPLIEQVIAAELLESARIRRLKSHGIWAMTCSIKIFMRVLKKPR
jgi:hypothetical protein